MLIFDSCVVTRVMYGLQSAWLNQAERRRIDGFHARCLRSILKIPHAYYSRVSNATVLTRAQARPLSTRLLQQHLIYFSKLARSDGRDPARACIFAEGSLEAAPLDDIRRRGRPRLEWGTEVRKHVLRAAGDLQRFAQLSGIAGGSDKQWRQHVSTYVPP